LVGDRNNDVYSPENADNGQIKKRTKWKKMDDRPTGIWPVKTFALKPVCYYGS